ncbi:MAG: flagellar motor protein [Holophagales bacterium]|nr:flagellar motor protein [Holophagales bacterium]MYF94219.1 flagellar motor protein [Holophagales bacterium]
MRLAAWSASLVVAIGFVSGLSLLLTEGGAAAFLLDRNSPVFNYPFTIQNLMWLIFFGALGELVVRYRRARREWAQLAKGLLPEDEVTMLRLEDLGAVRGRVRGQEEFFVQRLVTRCVLQFQSSKSTDRANALLNSSLDLMQHEVDTRYSLVRYLVWVIPTIGFIGTVVGIAAALGAAGDTQDFQDPALLGELTRNLGVAFYTTMLALIQSAILVLAQSTTQAREEGALNRAGQYCLDNLINRLYDR